MKRSVLKMYQKISEQYPDISPEEKEERVRKALLKAKLKRAGIIFLVGAAAFFSLGFVPQIVIDAGFSVNAIETIITLLNFAGLLCEVIGVCMAAAALHNPLTPAEREELKRRDTAAKET